MLNLIINISIPESERQFISLFTENTLKLTASTAPKHQQVKLKENLTLYDRTRTGVLLPCRGDTL